MKFLSHLFIILITGSSTYSQAFIDQNNSSGYVAGYQNVIVTDSTRTHKPGALPTEKFHFRPIEIDVWFPAKKSHDKSPIPYSGFLNLLEQRSNRFQNDTVYKSLGSNLVQYINANLNIQAPYSIADFKTASWLNVEPASGHFPLIIYMSSYNGMGYENINLFENLASHGYVCACITSVGRYPGNMSTKKTDLLEQVADGFYALQLLKKKYNTDPDKIGTIGYSWGGLAAWILSHEQKEIKAFLSMDGSEMHYYGESSDEDSDFNSLRQSFFRDGMKNQVEYAYLESGFKQDEQPADSIFNIFAYTGCTKRYVHFPKAKHEDFSCLPAIAAQILHLKNNSVELNRAFNQLSLNFFNEYLKNEKEPFTSQLMYIYATHAGDSLYPQTRSGNTIGILIKGKIIDMTDKKGVAYVNIGIPDKNRGTVSGRDGSFGIRVDTMTISDSLKISMVGYKSRSFLIADLLKLPKPLSLPILQQETKLPEIVVTQKKLDTRTLGNKTTSTFVSIGLPLKFLGSEIGIRVNLGKKPVLVKNFTFNISGSRLDTAVFRMNIYHFKNGIPLENILQKNILVSVGKRTGKYVIPLSDYRLFLKDDILISLEWIEGSASGASNGALFLSAAFLNSPTWHRITSQGKWKKATGLGVGFNIDVQKLYND